MPVLLNLANGGGSWVEKGITYERSIHKVGPPTEAERLALWAWLAPQLGDARGRGFFGD